MLRQLNNYCGLFEKKIYIIVILMFDNQKWCFSYCIHQNHETKRSISPQKTDSGCHKSKWTKRASLYNSLKVAGDPFLISLFQKLFRDKFNFFIFTSKVKTKMSKKYPIYCFYDVTFEVKIKNEIWLERDIRRAFSGYCKVMHVIFFCNLHYEDSSPTFNIWTFTKRRKYIRIIGHAKNIMLNQNKPCQCILISREWVLTSEKLWDLDSRHCMKKWIK